MQFNLLTESLEAVDSPCLVVAVGENQGLSSEAQVIDEASGGLISEILKAGDIQGKLGQSLMLHALPNIAAKRVLLIGCGELDKELSQAHFVKLGKAAFSALRASNLDGTHLALSSLEVTDLHGTWQARTLAQLAVEANYVFDELKSKACDTPMLSDICFLNTTPEEDEAFEISLEDGFAIGLGVSVARDLGNLPGNYCTPSYLAEQALLLDDDYEVLHTSVLEEMQMQALGMNSLLSVSAGSSEGARLITMEYKGGEEGEAPIVLLGKGITFDSGGISLKPGAAMDEMKYDMCGAASVMGAMQALCELGLAINVVGLIAAAENMPGPDATKPGDIITSMSGQTIEVLNTDAEGRLVLCDAMTYAERFKPKALIDVATLTGACIVALGHHTSGLITNNDELGQALLEAGKIANDKAWELPMGEEYQEQLKSNFADIANIGGPGAGTITAACFLSRFAKYDWAHLDIAGTAWVSGKDKGATGRPVPLLVQYLMDQA